MGIVPEVPVGFSIIDVGVDEEGFAVGGDGFDGFGGAAVDVAAHVFSFLCLVMVIKGMVKGLLGFLHSWLVHNDLAKLVSMFSNSGKWSCSVSFHSPIWVLPVLD